MTDIPVSFNSQICLMSLYSIIVMIFSQVFPRENPVIDMVKTVGGLLPKGYPHCKDNSS